MCSARSQLWGQGAFGILCTLQFYVGADDTAAKFFFSITASIILRPLTMDVVNTTSLFLSPAASSCVPTYLSAAISANVTPPKKNTKTVFQLLAPANWVRALAAFSSAAF